MMDIKYAYYIDDPYSINNIYSYLFINTMA